MRYVPHAEMMKRLRMTADVLHQGLRFLNLPPHLRHRMLAAEAMAAVPLVIEEVRGISWGYNRWRGKGYKTDDWG